MREFNNITAVFGGEPSQPLVALLGTSVQFSNQVVRVLRLEFDGVEFARVCELRALLEVDGPPNVVIVHETDPKLEARIEEVRATFPGALLAVACSDAAVVRQLKHCDLAMPVSALNMNAQFDVWFSVLRLLLSGHVYVPADTMRELREDSRRSADIHLTPREKEVLSLIADGRQNKVIAAELGLSEHTVKLHTHNIYSKLRVSNRTGATKWYLSQVGSIGNVGYDEHAK